MTKNLLDQSKDEFVRSVDMSKKERLTNMPKSLKAMLEEVHSNNLIHGWYDRDRPFSEDIALLTTEVAEAYEAYRDYGFNPVTADGGKPLDFKSELADILIRLLDTCQRYDVDLELEYERKMKYNRTRPYRHGNKLA